MSYVFAVVLNTIRTERMSQNVFSIFNEIFQIRTIDVCGGEILGNQNNYQMDKYGVYVKSVLQIHSHLHTVFETYSKQC